MRHKQKIMLLRIIIGITLLSLLVVLIVPKNKSTNYYPQQTNPNTSKQRIVMHTITLTAKGFEPKNITIKKGEVIVWTNKSGKQASVNSADHPTHKLFPVLNLGTFNDGSSVQARIFRTGELKYHNHLNPSQTGTITVTK